MILTGIIFYKEAGFAADTWFDLTDSDYLALEKSVKNTDVFNFASNVSICFHGTSADSAYDNFYLKPISLYKGGTSLKQTSDREFDIVCLTGRG